MDSFSTQKAPLYHYERRPTFFLICACIYVRFLHLELWRCWVCLAVNRVDLLATEVWDGKGRVVVVWTLALYHLGKGKGTMHICRF